MKSRFAHATLTLLITAGFLHHHTITAGFHPSTMLPDEERRRAQDKLKDEVAEPLSDMIDLQGRYLEKLKNEAALKEKAFNTCATAFSSGAICQTKDNFEYLVKQCDQFEEDLRNYIQQEEMLTYRRLIGKHCALPVLHSISNGKTLHYEELLLAQRVVEAIPAYDDETPA